MRSEEEKARLRREWIAAGLLLALGALLRLCALGALPYGLNQDEASIGYDAWTLLRYGIDRNGYRYPVYPITWAGAAVCFIILFAVLMRKKIRQ